MNKERLSSETAQFEHDVQRVAAMAHDAWRMTRKFDEKTGLYEPRLKPTIDETWIASRGGEASCDIANTSFDDLPADAQAENLASAQCAVTQAYKTAFYEKDNYDARPFLHFASNTDDAGAGIHDAWLDRNKSTASAGQKGDFDELTEEEKDKDRSIYIRAADVVAQRLKEGTFAPPSQLIISWLQEDAAYLVKSTEPSKRRFWQRKQHGQEPWCVTVDTLETVDESRLRVRMAVGSRALYLEGVYPLADTAYFMRSVRQNAPDEYETIPLRQLELARALHAGIQTFQKTRES